MGRRKKEDGPAPEHGRSAYINRGCRCEVCREDQRLYTAEYLKTNPAAREKKNKTAAKYRREVARFRQYGITKDEYESLCERQDHRCSICLKVCKLVIDHDHKTGSMRGLLCHSCNKMIGFAGESTDTLSRAIVYLENCHVDRDTFPMVLLVNEQYSSRRRNACDAQSS